MARKVGSKINTLDVAIKKSNGNKGNSTTKVVYGMKTMHYHDYYEMGFSLTKEQERSYFINDREYKFNPNCCVAMAQKGQPHMASKGFTKYRLLLCFQEDFGKEIFGFLGVDMDEFFSKVIYIFNQEQIDSMIDIGEKLYKECKAVCGDDEKIRNNHKIRVLFASFVSVLIDHIGVVEPVTGDSSMEEIVKYIDKNYRRTLTLDKIADIFYINKYTLCKKFREATGKSVVEYITLLRLNEAQQLFISTQFSVDAVASKVGYNSGKYFSKLFKKYVGMSPTEFKQNNR